MENIRGWALKVAGQRDERNFSAAALQHSGKRTTTGYQSQTTARTPIDHVAKITLENNGTIILHNAYRIITRTMGVTPWSTLIL